MKIRVALRHGAVRITCSPSLRLRRRRTPGKAPQPAGAARSASSAMARCVKAGSTRARALKGRKVFGGLVPYGADVADRRE